MSDEPPIQYARSADGYLAYQVIGSGPVDLLRIEDLTMLSIDSIADEPHRDRFDRRLSAFARVIRFDRRGIGLSDGHSAAAPLTLEQGAQDALAVLDAAGSSRAAVFGAHTAMVLAATCPDRVSHLMVLNGYARLTEAPDYPWGATADDVAAWSKVPDPSASDEAPDDVAVLVPSLAGDAQFRAYWDRAGRRSASPAVASAHTNMLFTTDVRSHLARIVAPTLLMHRPDNLLIAREHGQFLASQLRHATYVELPGSDLFEFGDDADAVLDEMEEFLTGSRAGATTERVLATVLFTDVVQSTEQLVDAGDRHWRILLDRHDALVRAQLLRFRGKEVSTAGDSFFAVFDSPANAIRCARAIVDGAGDLGIAVRSGVHTGECEVRGADYSGIAVHIGARIAALAGACDVLVSSTVRDLVAGSGITFEDRGRHHLKGIPGEWDVLAVVSGV